MCKCVYTQAGFSLLSSTLSNTMLFLLKSKGTAIYFFCSKTKKEKKSWSGRSQELSNKSHIYIKAAPNYFKFFKSELILCNIFSPDFFFLLVGGGHQFLSFLFLFVLTVQPSSGVSPLPVSDCVHKVRPSKMTFLM